VYVHSEVPKPGVQYFRLIAPLQFMHESRASVPDPRIHLRGQGSRAPDELIEGTADVCLWNLSEVASETPRVWFRR
jgi:hypothetical protein